MANPKAVAEIPWFERKRININSPNWTYNGNAGIRFIIPAARNNIKWLLDSIELKHNDIPDVENPEDYEDPDTEINVFDLKLIDGYHRADPTLYGYNAGTQAWDFNIFAYSGNGRTITYNGNDFGRVYFHPGDELLLVWRTDNNLRCNICATFRQV